MRTCQRVTQAQKKEKKSKTPKLKIDSSDQDNDKDENDRKHRKSKWKVRKSSSDDNKESDTHSQENKKKSDKSNGNNNKEESDDEEVKNEDTPGYEWTQFILGNYLVIDQDDDKITISNALDKLNKGNITELNRKENLSLDNCKIFKLNSKK